LIIYSKSAIIEIVKFSFIKHKNMETKKETTIDELAGTVNKLTETVDKLAEITQREFTVVKEDMGSMKSEMGSMKNEMGSMKSEMNRKFDRVDEKFNQVLNNQDQVLNRLENLETDNTAGAAASRKQEDKLKNHEERIIVAEKKLRIGVAI